MEDRPQPSKLENCIPPGESLENRSSPGFPWGKPGIPALVKCGKTGFPQGKTRGKPCFPQVSPWGKAGIPARMLHIGEIMGNGRWRKTVCSVGKITFILVKGNSHIFVFLRRQGMLWGSREKWAGKVPRPTGPGPTGFPLGKTW